METNMDNENRRIDTDTKGRIDFDDIGWFAACPNCDTLFRRRGKEVTMDEKMEQLHHHKNTVYQSMPNPSTEELISPMFNAIWDVIKKWDVNSPDHYEGYCGANGSHVKLILDVLPKVNR